MTDSSGTNVAALRIRFDDSIQPVHGRASSSQNEESRAVPDDEKSRARDDDEERARHITEQDFRGVRKQTYRGFLLAWVAFQSTGVIYGDIGTSPLYVYSSTFSSQPSWDDLVGALSIIVWSLTLIVTVKYAFVVLSADDDGQGGTFALYSLLTRYTHIATHGPPGSDTVRMERHRTDDMRPEGRSVRGALEKSRALQSLLQVAGVVGVSMVVADGVLTPAQSVLGAVQGLLVVRPDLGTPAIVGTTCAILVCLFGLQPFGTAKIGTAFAPVVTVWLLFNLCAGVYNLAAHDHTVLKACSPSFAFAYLRRNGEEGWRSLGGLLLAFTGVEALFADLGAFSKRAIQISWLALAYPCLVLAYAGQAAYISADETQIAYRNPFFYTLPPGSFYFGMVLSILAAVVASQAMITSTFQLLIQVMRLSYFPHIKVVHTSKRFHEQVYLPMANWLLMIGTVIVTAVYNNTTSLGHAYGVCVITVTFMTTCLVSLVALIVWRLPLYLVLPVLLLYLALDGAYLTSVLTKVPAGAWFTIVLSAILSSVFVLWRFGKEAQWAAEARDRVAPTALLTRTPSSRDADDATLRLAPQFGHTPVSTVPGLGVFFDKAGDPAVLPPSFTQFLLKFAARPAVIVLFHMRPLPLPSVAPAEHYLVTRVRGALLPRCYSVVVRHGYADDVLRPGLAHDLVAQIEAAVSRAARGGNDADAVAAEVETLRAAALSQIVYILGKEAIRVAPPPGGRWRIGSRVRVALLELYLWLRDNSRTKLADLDVDVDKLIEVGFVKEL